MLTKNINFKNFHVKKINTKIKEDLTKLLKEDNKVLQSLKLDYKNSYTKKNIIKLKKYFNVRIIGMGGSILGAESIYDFLRHKIKKNFFFISNLKSKIDILPTQKKIINLIVSKSGNTLETISNTNILVKKKDKNIFITENKKR